MGGTHHFHDTAGAEACHKNCIQLAGLRARIYCDENVSAKSMFQYNVNSSLIAEISSVSAGTCNLSDDDDHRDEKKSIKLTSPICSEDNGMKILYRGSRGTVVPERPLHTSTWDTVLCEGVPISLRELILLTVERLGGEVNMDNALKILGCSWRLGWHLAVSSNGTSRHYWGGGVTPKTSSNYLRGDWIETNVTDTSDQGVTTSRLARIICAMQISNIRQFEGNPLKIPEHTWETVQNKRNDTLFFLLVRYAQSHRYSGRRRGPEHRPLCPGILEDTHCLWSWAQKVRMRRGCLQGRSWERNKHFFGPTVEDQNLRRELERHAWYDLVQASEIVSYANVQYDPDRDNPSLLQSVMWC